jgi:hypothetical protein
VRAIFARLGSPRTSAWANCASFRATFRHVCGSNGSTKASRITGSDIAGASSRSMPQSPGSSIVKPVPLQILANAKKSFTYRSHGLPEK